MSKIWTKNPSRATVNLLKLTIASKKFKIWIKWLKVSLSGSFFGLKGTFFAFTTSGNIPDLKGWLLTAIELSSGDLLSMILFLFFRFFRIFLSFRYLIFYLTNFTSKFAMWPLKEVFSLTSAPSVTVDNFPLRGNQIVKRRSKMSKELWTKRSMNQKGFFVQKEKKKSEIIEKERKYDSQKIYWSLMPIRRQSARPGMFLIKMEPQKHPPSSQK